MKNTFKSSLKGIISPLVTPLLDNDTLDIEGLERLIEYTISGGVNGVFNLLRDRPDFTFMVGPEELTTEFVLRGGHGCVNGGVNIFPKLYVELYNASVNRDYERIMPLQQKVMQISTTIYSVGQYGSSYLKGLKCALSVMGIYNDFMAEPFRKFKDPERQKIQQLLDEFNYSEWI